MTTYYLRAKEWLDRQPQAEKDKLPALLAGAGLGLVIAQSLIFMNRPVVSYIFVVLGILVAIALKKKISLGPKWMYVPLLVLIAIVFLRAAIYNNSIYTIMPNTSAIGFIALMLCFYLAGRICGRNIFYMIPAITITLSLFVYINAAVIPELLVNNVDYNLVSAVLIIGTILTTWQRKWILIVFTLPAIFLTGASEGVLATVIIGVLVLLRKDWSHKVWLPAGALSIVFLATFYTGATDTLYARTADIITDTVHSTAISDRLDGYSYALTDIKIFGHGFNPTETNHNSVHNVPLRALYELGPIAALAWCYAMLVGLIKTRYKYAFAAILAFSLVDHLMWTWLAPIPWVVAGVATVDNEGDYLFRKETI